MASAPAAVDVSVAPNAFITTVAPLIGNLLSVVMLLSPLPAVWNVRQSGALKALNTLPLPMTLINCTGWVFYGLSLGNMWIVPANLLGVCAGLFFTLQVVPALTRKIQDKYMGLLVAASLYFGVLGIVGANIAADARSQMWGTQSVVILMLYYAIPLSSMSDVIKQRNAASIYLPLAIAAFLNGGMWAVYGLLAASDINIWLPNATGALLATLQIALRLVYGAKEDPPLLAPGDSPSAGVAFAGGVKADSSSSGGGSAPATKG